MPMIARANVDVGFVRIEPVAIRGGPLAVGTLLRNLIDNAVRYTPAGGRVDIAILREGQDAVLRIEDTGPGIPEADLLRIFDPFFRGAEPRGEGTGLGLAIVERVLDRLGGSIRLENRTDAPAGLRATVRAPAA